MSEKVVTTKASKNDRFILKYKSSFFSNENIQKKESNRPSSMILHKLPMKAKKTKPTVLRLQIRLTILSFLISLPMIVSMLKNVFAFLKSHSVHYINCMRSVEELINPKGMLFKFKRNQP